MTTEDKNFNKWFSPKKKLPPHNTQVLNEYGCVVTYNHKTKKWKDSYGRVIFPKVWKYKE